MPNRKDMLQLVELYLDLLVMGLSLFFMSHLLYIEFIGPLFIYEDVAIIRRVEILAFAWMAYLGWRSFLHDLKT